MSRPSRRRHLAAALAALVALSLTGCSSGDDTSPQADPAEMLAEPGEAPTLQVEPVTTSGRLVGRLPRKDRHRAEQAVATVAVRWLQAAYVGGSYPRRGFRDSFPGFTTGARRAAMADLGLLTNKRIGRRITGVTPTAIRVRVDLLAVGRRPVSGTAHVLLRYRTEGRVERRYRVTGRLMMTRHGHGWQVFGYDVSRSLAAPPGKRSARHGQERHDGQRHRQQAGASKKHEKHEKRKKKGDRG